MTKAELEPVKEAAVAEVTEPAFQVETSATDMVLPFLKIIQSQADEVTKGKDKYNDNVRPGDIYDSVTRTIYRDPEIIICGIRKYYGEWDGDVRGRLLGKHRIDSDVVINAKKVPQVSPKGTPYYDLYSKAGNRLEETFGVVCVVEQEDLAIPATFTLSKSSFAVGKTLNTMLTMFQRGGVPKFKFSTNTKTNDKGSWFVPVFEFAGYETNAETISMAAGVNKMVDNIIFAFSAGEVDAPTPDNDDIV